MGRAMRTLLNERVAEEGLEAGRLLLSGSGHLADREGCQRLIGGQRMDSAEGRKEGECVLRDEGFACRSFPPGRDRGMLKGGKGRHGRQPHALVWRRGCPAQQASENRGLTVL